MDIRNFIEDLSNWQNERRENPTTSHKPEDQDELRSFPVRGRVSPEGADKENMRQTPNQLKRDKNQIKDYYDAWDKFDVVISRNALKTGSEPARHRAPNAGFPAGPVGHARAAHEEQKRPFGHSRTGRSEPVRESEAGGGRGVQTEAVREGPGGL